MYGIVNYLIRKDNSNYFNLKKWNRENYESLRNYFENSSFLFRKVGIVIFSPFLGRFFAIKFIGKLMMFFIEKLPFVSSLNSGIRTLIRLETENLE